MISNYLAIALRNIRQNPLFSLINMFSLAIGLAACLIIYLFIADEKSFDSFHSQRESIYRLDEVQNFSFKEIKEIKESLLSHPQKYTAWFHLAFPKIEKWLEENGSNKISVS